jgi:hypothetical protein
MTLRTAEGGGKVHVRVNEAGNYKTVGRIDDKIA